jgi:hypothetical protein
MARVGGEGGCVVASPGLLGGSGVSPGHDAPDPLRRDNSRPSPHTRRVGALTYPRSIRKQSA